MIRTLSLFALALPAFSALMIGPITTTGHVSYVIGSLSSGSGQTVSASGSDGQNSIAIYINDGITPTSGYPFFSHHRYNNSIGTSFSFVNNIRYFDFDAYFGGTQGRLIIYASNTPTIIVDFVGYSVNSMNFTDINGTRGSFDIVAAPEPATFGLAAFALAALAWRKANPKP